MNEKVKVVMLAMRSFQGRTGTKFQACSMLNLQNGSFMQASVPAEIIDENNVVADMHIVYELELEDAGGLNKKIVGFEKTEETYEINLVS